MKKQKKKKIISVKVIQRRLFKLSSILCRDRANHKCEICGLAKGDKHPNTNKPQHVEAHHVMSRANKNSPLKYDLRNLICLCTSCHKTSRFSAHKHGLWFAKEFIKIRPNDAEWIIEHTTDCVDLDDRNILNYIEHCLKNNIVMDFSDKQLNISKDIK
jgi:hypothetical protein